MLLVWRALIESLLISDPKLWLLDGQFIALLLRHLFHCQRLLRVLLKGRSKVYRSSLRLIFAGLASVEVGAVHIEGRLRLATRFSSFLVVQR